MSVQLQTSYLGLKLKNPLIVGASPLVDYLNKVREIEDSGAAAIVMHSLFEEQVETTAAASESYLHSHEETFAEATSYFPSGLDFALGPERYLEQMREIKKMVSIPLIGSLNGRTPGGWTGFAEDIEEAGADALELNLYFQPTDTETPAAVIESEAIATVRAVRERISIPIAVKISPFFTSIPHFARRIADAGATALTLFNRFYQPDIDIENLETVSSLNLSESSELRLRLRWMAILRDRIPIELSCTGGVHSAEDAIKAIMAGADTVQLVSCLLRNGPSHLAGVLSDLTKWLDEFEYTSIDDTRASMSYRNTPNPEAIERANYLKILQTWKP